MEVLAGDVGGTNARLAIFDLSDDAYEPRILQTYSSREYESLEAIIKRFLDDHAMEPQTGCFGIPGPVQSGRAEITNLPWVVETDALESESGLERVALLNDLEAQAYGIDLLKPGDLVTLSEGAEPREGNRALLAAGTGLGQAGLFWDGTSHRPFACEGGHTSFAPRSELEIELLRFLERRFGHVSWERVLSGPGFVNIHDFLIEHKHDGASPEHVENLRKDDPAAITRGAMAGTCPLCVASLELFVRFYGAEAGNLALKFLAAGGVYLGGGIAPEILSKLQGPDFMEAFLDKGRMRDLLETFPVHVITNERTALLGAARYASQLASSR